MGSKENKVTIILLNPAFACSDFLDDTLQRVKNLLEGEMKQFKSNKKIISERYWQDNYINLFVEINKFLECRIQKDEAYGVYS